MGSKYHLYPRKYEDKAGKKYVLWWYWYWDRGKRIRKPAGGNGSAPRLKREAQTFIDALELNDKMPPAAIPTPPSLPRPTPSFGAPRTFKPFAETLYLPESKHLKRKALTDGVEISEETRKGHRSRLDNYLIPKWGDCTWSTFERDGFADDFIDWLVELKRTVIHREGTPTPTPKDISNSTRNSLVETMGIALREAKRARLLRQVPEMERFTRFSRSQDTLSDDELEKLFPEDEKRLEDIWELNDRRDHGTGILFGAMCCLGISAGLRSGELRAVSVDQIIRRRLPSGEMLYGLIVDKALNAKQQVVGLKKANKEDPRVRIVVLSDKTMRILDKYLASVPPRDGLVFLHRGMPVRKETLERRWAAGLRQAGINTEGRRLTPHAMRYTYNTRMRMLVDERTLHEFIGHKSEDMTMLYDRPHLEERLLQLADQRGAVERFWG